MRLSGFPILRPGCSSLANLVSSCRASVATISCRGPPCGPLEHLSTRLRHLRTALSSRRSCLPLTGRCRSESNALLVHRPFLMVAGPLGESVFRKDEKSCRYRQEDVLCSGYRHRMIEQEMMKMVFTMGPLRLLAGSFKRWRSLQLLINRSVSLNRG